MSGEINWGEPIEAVHRDTGATTRHVAVMDKRDRLGRVVVAVGGIAIAVTEQGFSPEWRIRNVAQSPAKPLTAPSGGEVGPEVVAAVVAALRAISNGSCVTDWADQPHQQMQDAADRALALLPEPVDADILTARKICAAHAENNGHLTEAAEHLSGRWDGGSSNRLVRATLGHLRSLEKGEAA